MRLWKLVLVVLIIFPLRAVTQDVMPRYQSFIIEQKEVVWVQVFHREGAARDLESEIIDHLKRKAWIQNIHRDGDDVVADLKDYRPDYKRYGGKYMNTSEIIRTGRWSGKLRINFKDGKYRVLLEGVNYEAKRSVTGSGKATIEQHDTSGSLSHFALNNYRNAFKKNRLVNLDILHASFKDSFILVEDQLIDSDW
jgi:hypothetical protein